MTDIVSSTIGSGQDYSTIGGWESAWGGGTDGDFVTNDEIIKGVIMDTANYNEDVIINGATVDSSHYWWLTVDSAARHGGAVGAGPYVTPTDTWRRIIIVQDPHCVFEYLEARATVYNGTGAWQFSGTASNGTVLFGCIGWSIKTYSPYDIGDGGVTLVNCLDVGKQIGVNQWETAKFYNCTGVDGGGFNAGTRTTDGNSWAKNCAAVSATYAYADGDEWSQANCEYNATHLSNETDAPGSTGIQTGATEGEFVDYDNDDFNLDSSRTVMKGNGTDLTSVFQGLDRSAGWTCPIEDAMGNSRVGVAWDIGWSQVTSGAGPAGHPALRRFGMPGIGVDGVSIH